MKNVIKKQMNIMLAILLLWNVQSQTHLQETPANLQVPTFSYLSFADYQKVLSDFLQQLIRQFNYQQEIAPSKAVKTEKAIEAVQKQIQKLSREQALQEMKTITGKMFDAQNTEPIRDLLNQMLHLSQYLDPAKDIKTIEGIKFLIDNQHRTSTLDIIFWATNIKQKDLQNAIPMDKKYADQGSALLFTLKAKLAAQAKTIKEEVQEVQENLNITNQAILL